jgi:hypothetical protein
LKKQPQPLKPAVTDKQHRRNMKRISKEIKAVQALVPKGELRAKDVPQEPQSMQTGQRPSTAI